MRLERRHGTLQRFLSNGWTKARRLRRLHGMKLGKRCSNATNKAEAACCPRIMERSCRGSDFQYKIDSDFATGYAAVVVGQQLWIQPQLNLLCRAVERCCWGFYLRALADARPTALQVICLT